MHTDKIRQFQENVWDYFRTSGRDLPWRHESFDVYQILVSEFMLQQTQVPRVIPKYHEFLQRFPTIKSLTLAPLADVLKAWSGLGYNRRAKYLHDATKQLVSKEAPWKLEDLVVCKGIGHNTAAAVLTYAYNQSIPFIETNIRTVYIHHFFADRTDVTDKEISALIEASFDREHPREWMWALMDYGSYLKTTVGNTARASKHYTTQSRFEGSRRQIRGQVLKLLGSSSLSPAKLAGMIADKRLPAVLAELQSEGLIIYKQQRYQLAL